MVRLDYLPYVCLQADNDIPLNWSDYSYQGQVKIKRTCNSLHKNKSHDDQTYSLIYEVRPAYKIGELFLHKPII